MNVFDRLNHFIRESDASLVNLLSAIAPWLAPLAPAYTTWSHMTSSLAYPPAISMLLAAVVEVLGLSTISTIISFWSYNKKSQAEYKKAPLALVVGSFLFYIAIIIVVNVSLDSALMLNDVMLYGWLKVLSRALLALMSIPAAVLLAVRTQHSELLKTIDREKAQRKLERQMGAPAATTRSDTPRDTQRSRQGSTTRKSMFVSNYKSGALQQQLDAAGLSMTPEVVANLYKVSVRTAYRWLSEVTDEF